MKGRPYPLQLIDVPMLVDSRRDKAPAEFANISSVKDYQRGEPQIEPRRIWDVYKRQENDRNHVFEFLGQRDGETTLPWDDEPDNESPCERFSDGASDKTKDHMDTDNIGKERGSEHPSHETLRWSIDD